MEESIKILLDFLDVIVGSDVHALKFIGLGTVVFEIFFQKGIFHLFLRMRLFFLFFSIVVLIVVKRFFPS